MHIFSFNRRAELISTIVNEVGRDSEWYHVQLALLLKQARDGKGGENCGCQSQVGVDGCPVLPIAVVGDGRVETRPEHPQEERTCGREDSLHTEASVKAHTAEAATLSDVQERVGLLISGN